MTGPVDEAGRGVEDVIAMLRATGNPKAAAEVAGLRTQLAQALQSGADSVEEVAAARDAWEARCAVLAGQEAAIRALHRKVSEAHRFDYDHYCAVCITAPDEGVNEPWPCPTIKALDSLVASSPTTPEAKNGD